VIEGVEGFRAEINIVPFEGKEKLLLMARFTGLFTGADTPEGLRGMSPKWPTASVNALGLNHSSTVLWPTVTF
jgi:hypothetical protein